MTSALVIRAGGLYMTTRTAARALGVHQRTIVRWLRRGSLRGDRQCAVKACTGCTGCRWWVSREDVLERLERLCQ